MRGSTVIRIEWDQQLSGEITIQLVVFKLGLHSKLLIINVKEEI